MHLWIVLKHPIISRLSMDFLFARHLHQFVAQALR